MVLFSLLFSCTFCYALSPPYRIIVPVTSHIQPVTAKPSFFLKMDCLFRCNYPNRNLLQQQNGIVRPLLPSQHQHYTANTPTPKLIIHTRYIHDLTSEPIIITPISTYKGTLYTHPFSPSSQVMHTSMPTEEFVNSSSSRSTATENTEIHQISPILPTPSLAPSSWSTQESSVMTLISSTKWPFQASTPCPTLSSSQQTSPTVTTTTTTTKTTTTKTTTATTKTTTATTTTTMSPPPPQTTTTTTSFPSPVSTRSTTRPSSRDKTWTRPVDLGINPCSYGRPVTDEYGSRTSCDFNIIPNGGCPEGYWCHTGTTYVTTVCCPRIGKRDRCQLPMSIGEGNDLAIRWFFDREEKRCRQFLYKGIRGNSNNFVTNKQCMQVCDLDHIVDAVNPCKYGTPANDTKGNRIGCAADKMDVCPTNFYCHIGDIPSNNACCESSGVPDFCMLAVSAGEGTSGVRRFYYSSRDNQCKMFNYRGTKGNENNFLTKEECEAKCRKVVSPCTIPTNNIVKCGPSHEQCAAGDWCHHGATESTTICCGGAVTNRCSLPLSIGDGEENVTRWWANPDDHSCVRECQPFQYRGLHGNQNNFLTKQECEEACKPTCENLCFGSSVLVDTNGQPQQCGPASPCPSSFWCHIGGTPGTNICCANVENICELPLLSGRGGFRLLRWHYDANSRKCISFVYLGTGGNQNMFMTKEDCEKACPSYINPCSSGTPIMIGTQPRSCSPDHRCPLSHYCHIGATGTPRYCCPKNGDPCEQPTEEGEGQYQLSRYTYSQLSRRCHRFIYKGLKGNANNFLSERDCEVVCPVVPNPCTSGEPFMISKSEAFVCGGSSTCPTGYFCHIGGSPETTNCCKGSRQSCELPVVVGEGDANMERWFFDIAVQECRKFIYKGLKGNSNNFITHKECAETCGELNPCGEQTPLTNANGGYVTCGESGTCSEKYFCHIGASRATTVCCPKTGDNRCELPMEPGNGRERLLRWHLDLRSGDCTSFEYTGSGGNENNFVSKQECEKACPDHPSYCPHGKPLIDATANQPRGCGVNDGCPAGFLCHMSIEFNVSVCCQDPGDFCLQPREHGPCTGNETRYGYDPLTDSCVAYEYGGCGGTLNNFKSLLRCTQICCKEFEPAKIR